jgi:hypothetical protein
MAVRSIDAGQPGPRRGAIAGLHHHGGRRRRRRAGISLHHRGCRRSGRSTGRIITAAVEGRGVNAAPSPLVDRRRQPRRGAAGWNVLRKAFQASAAPQPAVRSIDGKDHHGGPADRRWPARASTRGKRCACIITAAGGAVAARKTADITPVMIGLHHHHGPGAVEGCITAAWGPGCITAVVGGPDRREGSSWRSGRSTAAGRKRADDDEARKISRATGAREQLGAPRSRPRVAVVPEWGRRRPAVSTRGAPPISKPEKTCRALTMRFRQRARKSPNPPPGAWWVLCPGCRQGRSGGYRGAFLHVRGECPSK